MDARGVLAIDLGRRRTGLAIAHPPTWIALPLHVIHEHRFAPLVNELLAVAQQRSCRAIVLGLPLTSAGNEGEQTHFTRKFARFLSYRMTLPLYWQDERFTSQAAADLISDLARATGRTLLRKDQMRNKDAREAAIILQDFLTDNARLFEPDSE